MIQALYVKDLKGFTGKAKLYKLSERVSYSGGKTKYVVVSAVVAPFSGAETFIFPANEEGEVIDWNEMAGSYRGGLSHKKALVGAGYVIG